MIRRVLALLFFLLMTLATLMLVFLVWPTTPSDTAFTGIVPTLTPFYDPTDEAIKHAKMTAIAQEPTPNASGDETPVAKPPTPTGPEPTYSARFFEQCPVDKNPSDFRRPARRAGDGLLVEGGSIESSRFEILTTWYAHKGQDTCVFVKAGLARIEGQPDSLGDSILIIEKYTNDGQWIGEESFPVEGGTGGVRIIDADGMRLTIQTQHGVMWFDIASNTFIPFARTPIPTLTSVSGNQ